jgi:hypothetical protein
MAALKVLLISLMDTLKQKKCEPCKIHEILGLQREKCETCKIREIIQFCETILRKLESNEEPAQNEETFLKYISMVSQILGTCDELKEHEGSINSKIESYYRFIKSFSKEIELRYEGFMNYMNLSSCFWPSVPGRGATYKSSGGAQRKYRTKTSDDYLTIDSARAAMDAEKLRSLNEFKDISEQQPRFLKRLSDLKSFILDILKIFSLESPSSELSFFLSGFNQNHFEKFQYKFKVFDKMFQLLKAEIYAFNDRVMSEIEVCSRNTESIYPIIHHENWIYASTCFGTFYGKQD